MLKKSILFLVQLSIILASFAQTGPGVSVGGEISWRCLPNGQYIFSITQFSPCNRGRLFQIFGIDISSSSLPLSSPNGPEVSMITVTPDLARIQAANNGDTSPQCTPYQDQPFSCSQGDSGMVQVFYYKSDPISLYGIPPSDGWEFTTNLSNMSTNIDNLFFTGAVFLFRAKMYAGPNGQGANPCFDSSPTFSARPATYICRGYEFTYNHTAIDEDLDSLLYSWDRPYVGLSFMRFPPRYISPFSPTNPTPDQSFNINNIPASLDPLTGVTKLAVYSGTGVKRYWTTVQVDSYREGVKIATVYREIPITIFDCSDLPGSGGLPNNAPRVLINGVPNTDLVTTVTAGQKVSIPIQVVDNDRVNVAPFAQLLTMVPEGILFTQSKNGPSKNFPGDPNGEPCNITGTDVNPCAYLNGNPAPFVDATATPPETVVKGLGSIGVEFVWQTDCKHVLARTATPGANEGIYNFVLRVSDDHCPVPGINYPTVSVRVKDPVPLTEPIMKGISVLLDGTTVYNWVPPIDSARQFNPPDRQNDHYEAFSAKANNGQVPNLWSPLNTFITNYQQSRRTADFSPYGLTNPFDLNSGYNILSRDGAQQGLNFDYYIRMRTLSGCTDTNASIWSEPARIMELDATPSGVNPNPVRSEANLNWNRAKLTNAKTYSYFVYESPTHFYIYANDSISNGGVADPNNWYLVGDTTATTYTVGATNCSDYVGFRVEARDTVITWKEGSTIQGDSLDTLYFSTFSTVDTLFMEAAGVIPNPSLDTLEVLADGRVLLRINLQGKLTTGSYNIYENSINSNNLLSTVNALTDSVVVLNGANLSTKRIILEAVDACDATNKTNSLVYSSILPLGTLSNSCAGEYTLSWNAPSGFPNGVAGYRVYVDLDDGNGFQLDTIISNGSTTSTIIGGISRGKTFRYVVEAFDDWGAVNRSAIHEFTANATLATNALVPPPNPRCTEVLANGSVVLSWLPAIDTVNNFAKYQIEYKRAIDNTWTEHLSTNGLDNLAQTTDTIVNIDAQTEQYDFRITSLAGCNGDSALAYNTISSIYLTASPRENVIGFISDLKWNAVSFNIDYGFNKPFSLNRSEFNGAFEFVAPIYDQTLGIASDSIAIDTCRLPVSYRINHVDSIFKASNGFTCKVQSNVSDTVHEVDQAPQPEPLAMLTYNRTSQELEAHWQNQSPDADSINFPVLLGYNSGSPNIQNQLNNFIDITANGRVYSFPQTTLDVRDAVGVVGSIVRDKCGFESLAPVQYHKSMDVAVEWSECDSTNRVRWTQYVGLNPNFAVEYEVFYSTDGGLNWQAAPNSIGIDSAYNHLVTQGGLTYHYYVQARSLDPNAPNWLLPHSNVDSVLSEYEEDPRYAYLTYATVLPNKQVELEYFRDTAAPTKGYRILRGSNLNQMNAIHYVNAADLQGEERLTYIDASASTAEQEYYYQVVAENECDIVNNRSNLGRTIHLVVESNEGLSNTLRWNRYLEWDSTVAYYNIYRSLSPTYSTTVHQKVLPNSNYDYNEFVDDVTDASNSTGKFYYRVEAVQGTFNQAAVNGFPNDLTQQVSNSNIAEAMQNPLMYVPNAFAPNGVNRTFGPKGQFFDYTRFEMSIYNRWGEQIYLTNDINQGWDGTENGKEASTGSYVYIIRYVDGSGKEKQKKGSLTLIR